MEHEKEVEAFFEAMRVADKSVYVPSFEEIRKTRNRQKSSLIRLSIAASLILIFGIVTLRVNQKAINGSSFADTSPLSVEIESITTNSLIEPTNIIEEWKAPSNSLINNYH